MQSKPSYINNNSLEFIKNIKFYMIIGDSTKFSIYLFY